MTWRISTILIAPWLGAAPVQAQGVLSDLMKESGIVGWAGSGMDLGHMMVEGDALFGTMKGDPRGLPDSLSAGAPAVAGAGAADGSGMRMGAYADEAARGTAWSGGAADFGSHLSFDSRSARDIGLLERRPNQGLGLGYEPGDGLIPGTSTLPGMGSQGGVFTGNGAANPEGGPDTGRLGPFNQRATGTLPYLGPQGGTGLGVGPLTSPRGGDMAPSPPYIAGSGVLPGRGAAMPPYNEFGTGTLPGAGEWPFPSIDPSRGFGTGTLGGGVFSPGTVEGVEGDSMGDRAAGGLPPRTTAPPSPDALGRLFERYMAALVAFMVEQSEHLSDDDRRVPHVGTHRTRTENSYGLSVTTSTVAIVLHSELIDSEDAGRWYAFDVSLDHQPRQAQGGGVVYKITVDKFRAAKRGWDSKAPLPREIELRDGLAFSSVDAGDQRIAARLSEYARLKASMAAN
ncbi:MAG: hypothetical protein ACP5EN_13400 [Rhodovulum sp.]